jgi:hypothetical protein
LKNQTVSKPIAINDPGSLVENISLVCRLAVKSQLSKTFFEQTGTNLAFISHHFGLTEIESVLFCVMLNINLTNESVDLLDIARLVDCSPIDAFSLKPYLDSLLKKRIIKICENNVNSRKNRQRSKLSMIEYYISDDLIDSICQGEKFEPQSIRKASSTVELFTLFTEQFQGILDNTTTIHEVICEIQSILSANSHLRFVDDLNQELLTDDLQLLFLAVCCEYIDVVDEINLSHLITLLYKNDFQKQMRTRKSFLDGTNPLLDEKGLIKIDIAAFRCNGYADLTDKALGMLLPNRRIGNPQL